jgi:hypothetical protein
VSTAIVTVAVDTTTHRLLLILAAVLVGASVGLLGALILGAVKGVRATPGRAAAVRRSGPPPTRTRTRPAPEPRAEPETPATSAFDVPAMAALPSLYVVDSDVVRDRHRELYDAEYVRQLERVGELRRTIGTRLALAGEPHQPSQEPDPSEELDA